MNDIYFDSFIIEPSKYGIAKIDYGRHTIRVDAIEPGTITLKIKPRDADYIGTIFKVIILAKPITYLECEAPLGIACNTNWWGDENEYTYKVSDINILDLRLENYTVGSRSYKKLKVLGKKVGTADIYVYEANNQHTYTFTITVLEAVSEIKLDDSSITVKQGEGVIINILDGGGEYKRVDTADDNIATFLIGETNGTTGIIKISGKNPGITYGQIKDKYNQTKTVKITVEDTVLRLSYPQIDGYLELNNGNKEYITISESYKGVKSLTRNNDNITAVLRQIENNGETYEVVEVTPKIKGESLLKIEDNEGNYETVKIKIGEVGGAEDSDLENQIKLEIFHLIEGIIKKFFGLEINSIGSIESSQELSENVTNELDNLILKYSSSNETLYIVKKYLEKLKLTDGYKGNTKLVYDYLYNNVSKKLLNISEYEITKDVENGYIGGIYFKVDKPELVKEAGIDYYGTDVTNLLPNNSTWKTQKIEISDNGEYGAFILPKNKYNYFRGYIVTSYGEKLYTKESYGDVIYSEVGLNDYYGYGEVIASTGEITENNYNDDGVNVNNIAAMPILIFLGGLGISIASDYFCKINGGTFYLPSTWTQDNTLNLGCAVSAGTTLVAVSGLIKGSIKLVVTKFYSKEIVELTAKNLKKTVEEISILGANSKFFSWLGKGGEKVGVYIGYNKAGEAVYVGISNNIARRTAEHKAAGKLETVIPLIKEEVGLTKNQARAIEQNIINSNKIEFDENFINSIATGRDIYDNAIEWGAKFMKANGIKFTGF